jgi:hypothetical protein
MQPAVAQSDDSPSEGDLGESAFAAKELARRVILDHARDVSLDGVLDLVGDDLAKAGLNSDARLDMARDIHDLTGRADITITWPEDAAGHLAEIQARADAATKGPWVREGLYVKVKDDDEVIAAFEWLADTEEEYRQFGLDADFSAHAREDVRWLLAEVARLTTPPVGTNADHTDRLREVFVETVTAMADAAPETLAEQLLRYTCSAIWAAEREAQRALDLARTITKGAGGPA